MRNSIKNLTILLLLGALSGQQVFAAEEGVVDKTKSGIKKGAEATGRGVNKGIDATSRGVKKGVAATGRGLKKASKWIDKKAHVDSNKKKEGAP